MWEHINDFPRRIGSPREDCYSNRAAYSQDDYTTRNTTVEDVQNAHAKLANKWKILQETAPRYTRSRRPVSGPRLTFTAGPFHAIRSGSARVMCQQAHGVSHGMDLPAQQCSCCSFQLGPKPLSSSHINRPRPCAGIDCAESA